MVCIRIYDLQKVGQCHELHRRRVDGVLMPYNDGEKMADLSQSVFVRSPMRRSNERTHTHTHTHIHTYTHKHTHTHEHTRTNRRECNALYFANKSGYKLTPFPYLFERCYTPPALLTSVDIAVIGISRSDDKDQRH